MADRQAAAGLMVAEFVFRSFYRAYQLYFVSNDSALVPDPIYLPTLPNPANVASALMKALLNGPSDWLDPVADSAIPPETTLGVDSVTITDGIAEVALSDPVLALPDARRSLLAAQIVYTLKQAVGVKGVRDHGQPAALPSPGERPDHPGRRGRGHSHPLEPVPLGTGDPLYAVTTTTRCSWSIPPSATPSWQPLVGTLGAGQFDVDSLAVSVANTDVAVVTDGRTRAASAPTATGEVTDLATEVHRPAPAAVHPLRRGLGHRAGQGPAADLGVHRRASRLAVDAPLLDKGGEITAFKISPDGTRMALVRKTATGSELGLTRVIRADKITVDGWRPIDLTQRGPPRSLRSPMSPGWTPASCC